MRTRKPTCRLFVEHLEDRFTPATFTVLNTADSGADSLRQAILEANANPGPDVIAFNIGGGGVQTIAPTSALPAITDPVTIDGTTQPGFAGSPIIELSGVSAGSADGLVIISGNSAVRGLVINRFQLSGIALLTQSGNVIESNYLGTDLTGSVSLGNLFGIKIVDSSNSMIGGGQPGAGNVISGNSASGVSIYGVNSTGNKLQGNFIGTDSTGTMALGNFSGIEVNLGASANVIGTDGDGSGDATEGNVISDSGYAGVLLWHGGTSGHNVVAGNRIGTDVTGQVDLGNNIGVWVLNSAHNRIGTNADGVSDELERNIISGNLHGIHVNVYSGFFNGADWNVIAGNYIGTDITGIVPLGNSAIGVSVGFYAGNTTGEPGPRGTRIGGTNPVERNLISNGTFGIGLDQAIDTVIQGNYIGTDVTGTQPMGNANGSGILVGNSVNTLIGGNDAVAGNIIAFNNETGVVVTGSGALNNTIRGNSIHSNAGLGIDLGSDGVTLNDSVGHIGPNNFQNFPVIATAISSGAATTISGSLDSAPNATYTLDFYANPSADPSGYGEGKRYLGSATVTTDGSGHVAFSINLTAGMSTGEVCSATATDTNGNTSEFSLHMTVTLTGASLQPDECEPGQTALVVIGTSENDHIVINPVGSTGEVQVQLNGTSLGTFQPTGRIVVYAQAGDDNVQVAGGISLSAWLYGGPGNDRLKGGAGNDVLLGQEDDDLLVGQNGRDLLVGGTGADRIIGNGDDDILLAGMLSYEANHEALCAVMDEWTRTDVDYLARVDHLLNGSGLNGSFAINAQTVFNDTSEDILTGSAGLDWFIFDDVLDLATDLNHEAFLSDLAFING